MAKTTFHNGNMIATGHNNITGLTNIEAIQVKGEYFDPVDDLGHWQDGSNSIGGDGRTYPQGFAATSWTNGAMRLTHWWYLYTEILKGWRSNNVTIRTRRYHVPTESSGMNYQYVICNAVLTLDRPPDASYAISHYSDFVWKFTNITVIEEDHMYGELSVFEGVTAQAAVTTTPVLLTCFNTNGESDGVTVAHASDNMTVLAAGKWRVSANISFTGTVGTKYLFRVRVDAAEQEVGATISPENTNGDAFVSFSGILDLLVNEVVTIYVETDEAGGDSLTVTDARFSVERISSQ